MIPTEPRKTSPWIPLLLATITLLAMGRLCAMDFTSWDDNNTIHHNPHLNPPTLQGVAYYWTHQSMGLYVPVTYTLWAGLAAIAHIEPDDRGIALNPWIFHTTNVLLHLANTLLVYGILRRIVKSPWPAAAGALIFAAHPVQVETVGWISGMKDLLCAACVLGAIYHYLLFAQNEKRRTAHYWIAIALTAIATLCKPTAVVTPLLAAAIDRWAVGRDWRQIARSIAPLATVVLPCLIWAKLVQTVLPRGPLWSRPLVAADALAFYVAKLLWPAQLAIDYGRNPKHIIATGELWWTWLLPAAIATCLWLKRRQAPLLLAASALFVGGLLPILGFTPFMFQGYSTTADHYLYLPMLGVALAAAWLAAKWPTRPTAALLAVVITLLTIRSAVQTGIWADDETLNRHTLSVNPRSAVAHLNLGNELYTRATQTQSPSLREQAIAEYRETIRLKPDAIAARQNLAIAMIQGGDIDEGIRLLDETLHLAEPLPPAEREGLGPSYYAMGLVLAKRGRYDEAAAHFEKALLYTPDDPNAKAALAAARSRLYAPPPSTSPASQ